MKASTHSGLAAPRNRRGGVPVIRALGLHLVSQAVIKRLRQANPKNLEIHFGGKGGSVVAYVQDYSGGSHGETLLVTRPVLKSRATARRYLATFLASIGCQPLAA